MINDLLTVKVRLNFLKQFQHNVCSILQATPELLSCFSHRATCWKHCKRNTFQVVTNCCLLFILVCVNAGTTIHPVMSNKHKTALRLMRYRRTGAGWPVCNLYHSISGVLATVQLQTRSSLDSRSSRAFVSSTFVRTDMQDSCSTWPWIFNKTIPRQRP